MTFGHHRSRKPHVVLEFVVVLNQFGKQRDHGYFDSMASAMIVCSRMNNNNRRLERGYYCVDCRKRYIDC